MSLRFNKVFLLLEETNELNETMQFIIFIAFTLLVGIVAYLATRKTDENTEDGYFLGEEA